MPIKATCENCGAGLLARTADAGRRIKCPKCGAGMTVPDADPVAASEVDPKPRRGRERAERTGRTEGRRNRRKKVMLVLKWAGLWALAMLAIWVGLKVFVKASPLAQ